MRLGKETFMERSWGGLLRAVGLTEAGDYDANKRENCFAIHVPLPVPMNVQEIKSFAFNARWSRYWNQNDEEETLMHRV